MAIPLSKGIVIIDMATLRAGVPSGLLLLHRLLRSHILLVHWAVTKFPGSVSRKLGLAH